ncbi:SDR family NAD(P)-dependent oxidoreductase [Pseudonocardia endophytica]|uniref:3-oxoacyl-[acyl-carrier protein] reductase n=1 Tax=Pseudonocardia endophytica TaxID=401976 RepID=A0A4R1HNA5_PSEEN|nr:SDR family oxidoreductase [Pseudonocardia endophytica]TCK21840.1 3-oxoacyl-[acyl-carrier protein] reductase [Pseudonocardia endophytica]
MNPGPGLLDGRVAVVTGAANGLGRAYARRLAERGASVVVADLDEEGAQHVAAGIGREGGTAMAVPVDVGDGALVEAMATAAAARFGRIDILVNNAAIFLTVGMSRVPFDEISIAEWDRMMAVNVRGTWLACRAVVPHMRRQGYGKILNVSSDTALKGSPNRIHYVASKSAVLGFTRTLAAELGPSGIRVNAIAPGIVLSEPEPTEARYAQATAGQVLPAALVSDDLADTVVFLVSPASDPITGQVVAVNGGGYM